MTLTFFPIYIINYIYIIVVSIPKHLPVATVLQSYETTQSLRGVSLVRTTTDFGVNGRNMFGGIMNSTNTAMMNLRICVEGIGVVKAALFKHVS